MSNRCGGWRKCLSALRGLGRPDRGLAVLKRRVVRRGAVLDQWAEGAAALGIQANEQLKSVVVERKHAVIHDNAVIRPTYTLSEPFGQCTLKPFISLPASTRISITPFMTGS